MKLRRFCGESRFAIHPSVGASIFNIQSSSPSIDLLFSIYLTKGIMISGSALFTTRAYLSDVHESVLPSQCDLLQMRQASTATDKVATCHDE